ncbi:MAG: hypothetical protein ABSG71_01580 [Thermodesulfobacteriota bacterium]|jgi:hypothetical protein
MDTIFTVRKEDLQRLSPEEAVDFFRELLWAESTSIGIGKNLINVPSAITSADGGIDAEVQATTVSGGQGIIKQGLTRYQIKTGDFSLSREADIKSILFKEGTSELKPRVKSCLDRDGTLVIVLFGWDEPERVDEQHINKFKEKLLPIDAKCSNSKIEIWGQNKLMSFLTPFPSLALALKGLSGLQFQTYKSWSQNNDMRQDFVKSTDYQQKAKAIQDILRTSDGAKHIRIIDEAGGGKTRFILEATKAEDLAPLVLYTKASKFLNSDLLFLILREDNPFNVIIIADECSHQHRIEIWNQLATRGPRIKLITIYNEPDIKEHGIDYCDIPALSVDDIKQIILSYGVLKDHVDRWAGLAGNSPRFAHMIGTNLKYYHDDVLRPVEGIYDRIIAGYEDPNSEEVKKRKRVLMHIALFKRFGYRRPVEEEAKKVWKLVEKVDRDITWGKFQEIINKLVSLNILQGETTLYITPRAFHIRMWIEWWDTYGSSFDHDDFLRNIPENLELRKWFYEMLKFAGESGAAARVVKDLFGPTGPFKDFEYLKTKLGGRFFLALTEADPESALNCLKRTIARKTKDELLAYTTGRREVVWALERIAIWRGLFADAARILLALGEAENENFSNNASGVFAGLFSPAPAPVAPTEAPPQERLPVLKEALESPSKEKRKLALKAFDQALATLPSPRLVGAEYQGLRKEPELWRPKTWGELFDAYRQAWQLLVQKLESMEESERQEGVKILLDNSRGLTTMGNLADMVISTLSELSEKPYANKKEILSTVVHILHYNGKGLDEDIRKRLEGFRDELIGSGFAALLRRYVGMDLLEDQFDEEGKQVDKVQPKIEELAEQAIKDNSLLESELPWLITAEAQNGYRFGYEVGKRDAGFKLMDLLLKTQREASGDASAYFLGGYFRALFEKDQNMWEEQLDAIARDEKLNAWLPELTWRSGMSDRAALRLLVLAQKGIIAFEHFSMFGVGSVMKDLSEEVFLKLCTFLVEHEKYAAIRVALDLHFFYYIHKTPKPPLPKELTLRLLTHKSLFQKLETGRRGQMDEYHWTGIGKAFVQAYPEKSLRLADTVLEHFNEDGTILEGFFSPTQSVINEIMKKYPIEVWEKIKKYLGIPIDTHAYFISQWLRGGDHYAAKEGTLSFIPLEKIWEWVDEDVEERAWYLATFVPKALFREEGKTCLVRELLIRYGAREDVRRNLRANFSTEGWSGPASLHYQEKKNWLLGFKNDEDNENVKRWIDEYVSVLNREIEQARVEEERRF